MFRPGSFKFHGVNHPKERLNPVLIDAVGKWGRKGGKTGDTLIDTTDEGVVYAHRSHSVEIESANGAIERIRPDRPCEGRTSWRMHPEVSKADHPSS